MIYEARTIIGSMHNDVWRCVSSNVSMPDTIEDHMQGFLGENVVRRAFDVAGFASYFEGAKADNVILQVALIIDTKTPADHVAMRFLDTIKVAPRDYGYYLINVCFDDEQYFQYVAGIVANLTPKASLNGKRGGHFSAAVMIVEAIKN
jgi:hypothetical protein